MATNTFMRKWSHNFLFRGWSAISNVLKHAQASEIQVVVELQSSLLSLRIRNNGAKTDPSDFEPHGGLRSMRARAARLLADLEFHPRVEGGLELLIRYAIAPREAPLNQPC